MMSKWQVEEAPLGTDGADELLADGWEPFSTYLSVIYGYLPDDSWGVADSACMVVLRKRDMSGATP